MSLHLKVQLLNIDKLGKFRLISAGPHVIRYVIVLYYLYRDNTTVNLSENPMIIII